jgi:superfamily II DNA or RNA helicase
MRGNTKKKLEAKAKTSLARSQGGSSGDDPPKGPPKGFPVPRPDYRACSFNIELKPGQRGLKRYSTPQEFQQEAVSLFTKVRDFNILLSPTGSGKSWVAAAIAAFDAQEGGKCIICVPQTSIGDNFKKIRAKFKVSRTWRLLECIPAIGIGEPSIIQQIVDFVLEPLRPDYQERILLCTHQALVGAFDRLRNHLGDPWKGVSIFIDEAHHSYCAALNGDRDSDRVQNGLGALVSHYIRNLSGRIFLMTATWMREDAEEIIPKSARKLFERGTYIRHFEDHFASMKWLRRIRITFVSGDPLQILFWKLGLDHPADDPVIAYLPAPNTLVLEDMAGTEVASKVVVEQEIRRLLQVNEGIGQIAGRSFGFVSLVDDSDLRVRKLVSEQIRKGIDQDMMIAQRRRVASDFNPRVRSPDFLLVLNMWREGSDNPLLKRSILLAPRHSVRDMKQMLGRLTRDFEGKEEVEFFVILPTGSNEEIDKKTLNDYFNGLLVGLNLEWEIVRTSLFGFQAPEGANAFVSAVLERIPDAMLEMADLPGVTDEDVLHRVFRDIEEDVEEIYSNNPALANLSKVERAQYEHVVERFLRTSSLTADGALLSGREDRLQESPLYPFRCFMATVGLKDFQEIRRLVGRVSRFRPELDASFEERFGPMRRGRPLGRKAYFEMLKEMLDEEDEDE